MHWDVSARWQLSLFQFPFMSHSKKRKSGGTAHEENHKEPEYHSNKEDQTLIYEVNLSVEQSKGDDYLKWLQTFVEKMLKIDGFLSAEVFLVDSPNPKETRVSVQYRIENRAKLIAYLKDDQPRMAHEGEEEFKFHVLDRRTLQARFKIHTQSHHFGYVF